MKIAYIHNTRKISTGAHYINDLIVSKLRENGIEMQSYYPKFQLTDTPVIFKGINNILFFYSLLEKRNEILKCDIIQGTTYTPLAFMQFAKPVITHFGSTTYGFLKAVPRTHRLEPELYNVFKKLKKDGVIAELSLKTRRPMNDIATIENYAAQKANYVIATSEIVKKDLVANKINPEKIKIIHNAIEDYWFENNASVPLSAPAIVFLGRIGEDPFTLKLKGLDRLIALFKKFPQTPKLSVIMSRNRKLVDWLGANIPNHRVIANMIKDKIPETISAYAGSVMFLTSRYEGFSLSLIEGMSQGLVPVSFPVGVAPEIIKNEENGFIVNSMEEAETAVARLLMDGGLRERMSANAKLTAQNFKAQIMVEKMIALYKEIIQAQPVKY
jgi:glycosyltransferase involved in cell wall biosynthesis